MSGKLGSCLKLINNLLEIVTTVKLLFIARNLFFAYITCSSRITFALSFRAPSFSVSIHSIGFGRLGSVTQKCIDSHQRTVYQLHTIHLMVLDVVVLDNCDCDIEFRLSLNCFSPF